MAYPHIHPRDRRFHDLMPFRVREVLLVSSPYDAFILEQDGQLTEQVFFEYQSVSLSGPPRVTHVATGEEALARLEDQRFDVILVMTSLSDMGVNALGRRVKELRPGRAVILLALDRKELDRAHNLIDPAAIDGTFLWTGDAQILLAIIKYVEDRENVDHDVDNANVRVIIMIEDSPRYASAFLGMLYAELMSQSRSLYAEGINELERRRYTRSRPKILVATSYEEGVELFDKYRSSVMAVISDVRIPRYGDLDARAGVDFVNYARQYDPELPVVLQSAEPSNAEKAADIGAAFVDKNSDSLLADIRNFLRERLGFGDFIFRLPNFQEIGRASDVRELERQLATIPDDSLMHHAKHNDFSVWLTARSEFDLAERLRPRQFSEFPSVEAMRHFLIEQLRDTHRKSQHGLIADFSREQFHRDLFSRIGQGSLGGKARGIAFLNQQLAKSTTEGFGGLAVSVPKTVVVTTDFFDEFMEENRLRKFSYGCADDQEINRRFLEASLPENLRNALDFTCQHIHGPLAVRSSSLLEDSMHQPLAGIYSTLMIPNQTADPEVRLRQICSAVKLVYASTFLSNAKAFLSSTGNRVEEEKMAVIIQSLIGQRHDNRFYPHFAGVAQSHNFYPIAPQRSEDGIVHVALGLGRIVVDDGLALRFSPKHPGVLPQHSTPKALLNSTQTGFYALDTEADCFGNSADLYSNIRYYDLAAAEEDGTLLPVGSVYSTDDEQIRDNLNLPGPRVVTFNNLLKHEAIPLSEALTKLLQVAEQGLGSSVEIEFACDMGDWGKPKPRDRDPLDPVLYPLQIRPFATAAIAKEAAKLKFRREDIVCSSSRSLGHGVEDGIRDIVYVRRDNWDPALSKQIAIEVGNINETLNRQGRPYMLIGPGRWGTADPWLGIPVQWSQISAVRLIVEASPRGYEVEPSQGTHFFQNITSLRIGYITLPPGVEKEAGAEDFFDWEWLESRPATTQTEHTKHIRLEEPVTAVLDGPRSRAVIALPEAVSI